MFPVPSQPPTLLFLEVYFLEVGTYFWQQTRKLPPPARNLLGHMIRPRRLQVYSESAALLVHVGCEATGSHSSLPTSKMAVPETQNQRRALAW